MSGIIDDLKGAFDKAGDEAELRKANPGGYVIRLEDGSLLAINLPGGRFRRKDGEAKRIHTTRNGSTGRKA